MGERRSILLGRTLITSLFLIFLILFSVIVYATLTGPTIISPADGGVLDYNQNINLDFTVSSNVTLNSCWYIIDNETTNYPIADCQNTTLNVSDSTHNHTIYIYAKDSEGDETFDTHNFSIQIDDDNDSILNFEDFCEGTPASIIDNAIYEPTSSAYTLSNLSGVNLRNVSDFTITLAGVGRIKLMETLDLVRINTTGCLEQLDLDSYINISQNFIEINVNSTALPELDYQANLTLYNLSFNNPVILKDGSRCSYSDCEIEIYDGQNLTFIVDDFSNYSAVEAPICAEDKEIPDIGCYCENDVYYNGYCCDNEYSSSFCDDDDDSGGSSGDSSDSSSDDDDDALVWEISGSVSDITLEPGAEKEITWNVENTGTAYLSACFLSGSGDYGSWITSDGLQVNLASDDSHDFVFDLKVPEDTELGDYELGVFLSCAGFDKTNYFTVKVEKKLFDMNVTSIKKSKSGVTVSFFLEELEGEDRNVEATIMVYDLNGTHVGETVESKIVYANTKENFKVKVPVESGSINEGFDIKIDIKSGNYVATLQETVSSDSPILGGAIFGNLENPLKLENLKNIFSKIIGVFSSIKANKNRAWIIIGSSALALIIIGIVGFMGMKIHKTKKERKLVLGY